MTPNLRTLLTAALCAIAAAAMGANNERVVQQITDGKMLNEFVSVEGLVTRWDDSKPDKKIFEIKDNWGDTVLVITRGEWPPINKPYKIEGYVSFDRDSEIYLILENNRELLEKAPTPIVQIVEVKPEPTEAPQTQTVEEAEKDDSSGPDGFLIFLIASIVIVIGALIYVLTQGKIGGAKPHFDTASIVTISDKTQKISAPVAQESAVKAGTVKIMPGWFEVVGGVELKLIQIIRPAGASDAQLEYTFGRLALDRITHIQLNDPTVSSRQAVMRYQDGHYFLKNIPDPNDPDRNATLLNGEKMNAAEERALNNGDRISMGHIELIFHVK